MFSVYTVKPQYLGETEFRRFFLAFKRGGVVSADLCKAGAALDGADVIALYEYLNGVYALRVVSRDRR